ncbi:hypothetical protein SLEP1_g42572 [Rubroshorea leprosula]|uniref:Uncharacterized protein n=1 Tax=Rubroshorea leprosula TaxID=152421 RepID=A0AAV5LAA9_9ROSI|nr:hypothetical protein SLEP1_g42572 [Rubroshorea leprosula]
MLSFCSFSIPPSEEHRIYHIHSWICSHGLQMQHPQDSHMRSMMRF